MPDRLTQCPYLDIARRNREERAQSVAVRQEPRRPVVVETATR